MSSLPHLDVQEALAHKAVGATAQWLATAVACSYWVPPLTVGQEGGWKSVAEQIAVSPEALYRELARRREA